MTEQEHIDELDALAATLDDDAPPPVQSREEEAQDERRAINKEQMEGLLGVGLTAAYGVIAPNWQVQPDELEDAAKASMLAIEHYFPDIENFDHPLLILGFSLAMPALPRVMQGIPAKAPKAENESESDASQPDEQPAQPQPDSGDVADGEIIGEKVS